MRGNLQKEAFWTFLKRKSEEKKKSPIHAEFGIGRRQDLHVTPSLIDKEVDNQDTRDAPECFLKIYT